MARQRLASEFNTFIGGFVTEVSPLTFPGNAAIDIENFIINKTGTITRRLGMDFEAGGSIIDTGVSVGATGEIAINSFNWNNAGGDITIKLIVIQTGNVLKFFDANATTITSNLIHTHTYTTTETNIDYSSAVVDGILVLVTGDKEVSKFTYDNGTITHSTYSLMIRDLFGVEDIVGDSDLRSPSNINTRPAVSQVTDNHIYNLRNSTYSQLRLDGNNEDLKDPIQSFIDADGSSFVLPSNADSVIAALFPDANDNDDRFTERFFAETLKKSPIGNFESPTGYFIIDALDRGNSRLSEFNRITSSNANYIWKISNLPLDRTPGGAIVVEEFAGRAWYGGFSGEVLSGDNYSPRMSSYILFSSLVENQAGLGTCHQIGDPTSKVSPDLVDTDGGFIRLDGAYGIVGMVNVGSSIVVVANNGVWAVVGGNDFGFSSLDFKVNKITDHGCVNKNSIVLLDNTIMYWGDDGIYQISTNEFGDLVSVNLTNKSIQTFYENITDLDKLFVQGHFDTFERRVRWVYNNRLNSSDATRELVLDTNISAFYKNTIPGLSVGLPNLVAPVEVPPFKVGVVIEDVVDGGVLVEDSTVQVQNSTDIRTNGLREILYVTITSLTPTVKYTLSKYSDETFVDWKTSDGTGVDSPSFILTGYNGGEDFQRYKQVPYITFHFERTEDGFFTDGNGDIFPLHESSCKVQAQWEWANSAASGRWGREFQAYRYKRVYIPADDTDSFDTGFSTVVTKNKLRGKGKVLSMLIKTEPLKDCKLLGWSTITSKADDV